MSDVGCAMLEVGRRKSKIEDGSNLFCTRIAVEVKMHLKT
jgi:hypothetical protein